MRTQRWLAAALVAAALAGAGPLATAQWLWRDNAGRLNASDLPPPPDVPDKNIIKRPVGAAARGVAATPAAAPASAAAPAASAASVPRGVDAELEARRARAEQEKAARAKAEDDKLAAQRAENCRRARAQLALIDSGQRIARVDDKGERVVLDDAARAAEAAAAQRAIAADCR